MHGEDTKGEFSRATERKGAGVEQLKRSCTDVATLDEQPKSLLKCMNSSVQAP